MINPDDLVLKDIGELTEFKVQDITPIETKEIVLTDDESKKLDSDFEVAREGIASVLRHAEEAIKESISLARAAESPRAWEVVSTMMKTMVDINTSLIDLHNKKADVNKKTNKPDQPQNQTNIQNNFVGTTQDIIEMLKKQQ